MRLQSVANELNAENDNIRASLDDRTEDAVVLKRELTKSNKLLEEKMVRIKNLCLILMTNMSIMSLFNS